MGRCRCPIFWHFAFNRIYSYYYDYSCTQCTFFLALDLMSPLLTATLYQYILHIFVLLTHDFIKNILSRC